MKKIDSDLVNIKKQNKRRKKKLVDIGWIIKIILVSFLISFTFSFASETIIPNVNIFIGILILIIFIVIGIIFDMIGMSVASANPIPFHSMNSRKVKGAALAIKFIKNSDKVSSFCNDVIGDICGIVSGSAGAIVSVGIATKFGFSPFITTLIVMSIVSALTIGGKAIFKAFAINRSNIILFRFCRLLSIFKKA